MASPGGSGYDDDLATRFRAEAVRRMWAKCGLISGRADAALAVARLWPTATLPPTPPSASSQARADASSPTASSSPPPPSRRPRQRRAGGGGPSSARSGRIRAVLSSSSESEVEAPGDVDDNDDSDASASPSAAGGGVTAAAAVVDVGVPGARASRSRNVTSGHSRRVILSDHDDDDDDDGASVDALSRRMQRSLTIDGASQTVLERKSDEESGSEDGDDESALGGGGDDGSDGDDVEMVTDLVSDSDGGGEAVLGDDSECDDSNLAAESGTHGRRRGIATAALDDSSSNDDGDDDGSEGRVGGRGDDSMDSWLVPDSDSDSSAGGDVRRDAGARRDVGSAPPAWLTGDGDADYGFGGGVLVYGDSSGDDVTATAPREPRHGGSGTGGGKGGGRATPKPPTTPRPVAVKAGNRDALVARYYAEFNEAVFEGKLAPDLAVTWNPKLRKTAGLTFSSRRPLADGHGDAKGLRYHARIELATKVVDSVHKLRSTLLHEMCHVAAWVVHHVNKPPHGKHFRHWASRATAAYPDCEVTTCHTYSIHYRFRYQCSRCLNEFGRHSKSVDITRQVCARCKGPLQLLGAFNKDGTPAKQRKASAFSLFVKQHYAEAKRDLGPAAAHAAVMSRLSTLWKDAKGSGAVAGNGHHGASVASAGAP